ncbi:SDR family NAD(P)-dependent oxidoreductase [Nonomuraea jabiensis]|uniref:NADP-dependent 3-hydroxy acid dehydrogenase YdfG n=1 Tax=Nonomuraea jabiensis TaxID=882448 RepID=A0A7W9FYP8_9ACTN|nr:SDR family NAD(P)-dependent oxidoreductase [Nonomuraea jabiensis]MBB5774003.1 NADP-dependent 3-hydroxy acid dehydrogenase YdfG [Nonomuraea jabiensis]
MGVQSAVAIGLLATATAVTPAFARPTLVLSYGAFVDALSPIPQLTRREGTNSMAKTWLITGASSGLGRALAEYALAQGDRAVVTASSTKATTELASRHPRTALALPLDVTDPQQRENGVKQAEEYLGGIDILVNHAGIDFIGALEEQDENDYRRLFEVNFFGAVALTRLVLPGMRARGHGTIVNVSSMDGLASLPANGYYSASKFASKASPKPSGRKSNPSACTR